MSTCSSGMYRATQVCLWQVFSQMYQCEKIICIYVVIMLQITLQITSHQAHHNLVA